MGIAIVGVEKRQIFTFGTDLKKEYLRENRIDLFVDIICK